MDFSKALEAVKAGRKIRRKAWNGTGMFIVYQKGYPDGIAINKNTSDALGEPEGTICKFLPYLLFKTAQGPFVPWLASQTDILSDDWEAISDNCLKPNSKKLFAFQSTRRNKDVIYREDDYGANGFYKRAPELDKVVH